MSQKLWLHICSERRCIVFKKAIWLPMCKVAILCYHWIGFYALWCNAIFVPCHKFTSSPACHLHCGNVHLWLFFCTNPFVCLRWDGQGALHFCWVLSSHNWLLGIVLSYTRGRLYHLTEMLGYMYKLFKCESLFIMWESSVSYRRDIDVCGCTQVRWELCAVHLEHKHNCCG